MTPYALLLQSCGLSQREAAEFHGVRIDTVKSWSSGRNRTPDGAMDELYALIDRQAKASDAALDQIEANVADQGMPEAIEIGYCADDHEARTLGWPCASAHAAVVRRLLEIAPDEVREALTLIPRGSTAATAAAADRTQS